MEPLSVIASITGVLTAAAKISTAASSLVTAWKDAPASLSGVITETAALGACLTQLEPFVRGLQKAPESHSRGLSVEQIVTIMSSCVLAVSELQRTLDSLKPHQPLPRTKRLRWPSYEKKINKSRSRVQSSTTSLNLVLTALTW